MAFPTSPISADAVLLMSAHVVPSFAGGGLGRMLIQGVARDVAKRGIRAIEAFGDAKFGEERDETSGCLAPADFFLAVGFKTVRPHPGSRVSGWSCARRCRGSPMWSTRWSGCSDQ